MSTATLEKAEVFTPEQEAAIAAIVELVRAGRGAEVKEILSGR